MSSGPPPLSRSAAAIRGGIFAELEVHIAARLRAGGDLVGLHLGDSLRLPPSAARFALLEPPAGDESLYRYSSVTGLDALKYAFAARLAALGHGPPGVDPERHVLVGGGGTHALFCALRAILDPGDEVLVVAPHWPLATGMIRAAGGVPVEVPGMASPSSDAVDGAPRAVDRLRTRLTPRTRAIYLATPNNPDGRVLSTDELESIARFAREHDLWAVADEVYADYVYEGAHVSIAALDQMGERTITLYSLSKSHALAGVRVGFAVAPEAVVAVARRVGTHTLFHVPVASQRVALAALAAPPSWVDDARAAYREARDVMVRDLSEAGLPLVTPRGGSFAFVDFAPVLGGRPLGALLERAVERGVLLAPGEGFGAGYASWARICFTAHPVERLREGLARLRQAIV